MGMTELENPESGVCNPDRNGRILKSDHSGRSFDWAYCARVMSFRQAPGVRRVSVLSELKVGETGVLIALDLPESVQNHLMHMGFVPDALVTALRRAPAGDPTVYGIDGMEIALRHETAGAIRVRIQEARSQTTQTLPKSNRVADQELDRELIEVSK
jgi:ferrous iron transport protein A